MNYACQPAARLLHSPQSCSACCPSRDQPVHHNHILHTCCSTMSADHELLRLLLGCCCYGQTQTFQDSGESGVLELQQEPGFSGEPRASWENSLYHMPPRWYQEGRDHQLLPQAVLIQVSGGNNITQDLSPNRL